MSAENLYVTHTLCLGVLAQSADQNPRRLCQRWTRSTENVRHWNLEPERKAAWRDARLSELVIQRLVDLDFQE